MKIKRRTVLLLALLSAVSCLAAGIMVPRFIARPDIQLKIKRYIEANAPSGVETGSVSIKWLPLPHLEVRDIKIKSPQFKIHAPQIALYPNWLFMFQDTSPVSMVEIFSPDIKVLEINKDNGASLPLSLLPGTLVAHNATVRSNAGIFLPGLLLGDRVTTFRDCMLKVQYHKGESEFHIQLSGKPEYAQQIEVSMELHQDMQQFAGWARFTHLDLNRLFSHYIAKNAVPVTNDINIFLSVSSSSPGFYEGALRADTPCITLPSKSRKEAVDISCGVLSMDMHVTPDEMDASILKFDLESPHLKLAGNIHVDLPGKQGKEPYWDINLKASDIDLSGVRAVVLNLFGKSAEARQVCDIVRGGRAKSLTYTFKGATSDFEYIDHMVITAEVDRAPIYIPDPDLFLDEASGPIVIRDGILSGKDLTARIGKSRGWNGTLELGLSDHLFQFRLGLELEADITELKPLLEHLIDAPDVVKEIKKFHNVRGNALGSLRIGDDLRDFNVWVRIKDVNAQGYYERLGWPVKIATGSAEIGPHSVSWADIEGFAGKSRIRACSGMIDWKGKPRLAISRFRADISGREFLRHLLTYPALKKDILPVITGIDGTLSIHSAHLKGPAFMPEKWQYSLNASPVFIKVDSPLLPENVTARSGKITFSNRSLILRDLNLSVSGDPIELDGDLRHRFLTDWSGKLSFSGRYGKPIDKWVTRNGWSLPAFELVLPCNMLRSSVKFDEKGALFSGKWLFNQGRKDETTLSLERYEGKEGFELKKLEISNRRETALMKMKSPASGNSIAFSWQGRLSADTVKSILVKKELLQGEIDGTFSFFIGQDENVRNTPGFRGALNISGLRWLWGVKRPFIIEELQISGDGGEAEIRDSRINLSGDIIHISGKVYARNEGMGFDARIGAGLLHQSSIDALSDDSSANDEADEKQSDSNASGDDSRDKNRGLKVDGTASFSIGTYTKEIERASDHSTSSNATQPLTIEIEGLKGRSRFYWDGAVRTEITSGRLCALEINGSELERRDEKLLTSFHIKTPEGQEGRFEELTSCLNSYSDIIQGPFTVDAAFDTNGTTITRGHIDIVAHDGKLSRFTMLSRIFSIVNLVDFLGKKGWQELTSKGLAYSVFRFRSIIDNDALRIEEASVYGNGLNIFATGNADINSGSLDLQVVVAPLKTIDAIVTNIPLIGKGFGGEHNAFLTIPVSVKGDVNDPVIKLMPVKTFTDIFKKLITGPIKGPVKFLKGLGVSENGEKKRPGGEGVPLYDPETKRLIYHGGERQS